MPISVSCVNVLFARCLTAFGSLILDLFSILFSNFTDNVFHVCFASNNQSIVDGKFLTEVKLSISWEFDIRMKFASCSEV